MSPAYNGRLKDILLLLLTAGADVYACDDEEESLSDIADRYGQWQEWTDASTECGYEPDEVMSRSKEGESTC